MMIMKKTLNSLFVIIASMIAFAGCAKQEVEAPASETKTVQFIAESIETKTHFDAPVNGQYPTLWDEGDKVKILLNLEAPSGVGSLEKTVTVSEISPDLKSASFTAELNAEYSFQSYTFYAVVPSSAYNAKSSTDGRFTVLIPADQTPQNGSVDKAAQVLYAISETSSTMPSSVPMTFKHYTAYGKLSLSNLTGKVSSVSSITLESADVDLAGKWNYFVADGSVAAREGANKLTLTTSATENIWFACAPVDMSNKELVLTVNTDKGPLVKNITFPANRKFESGKISVFTVDMAGIEPEEQSESSQYYVKVTEEQNDWSGKYLIVFGNNAHASLSSKDLNSTCSVTILNDKIAATDALASAVMTVTKSGEKYHMTFADGKYFGMQHNGCQLMTDAFDLDFEYTSSGVKISGYVSAKSATYILYNNANQYYRCYVDKNGQAGYTLPTLYKLEAESEGGETPEPDTTPEIVVSGDHVREVECEGGSVIFNYTLKNLDNSLTVSVSNPSMLVANAADGELSVTVAANEGEARTGTITLTCGDAEAVVLTINQKEYVDASVIEELTIAEFLEKSVSANVWYKLSGTVTDIYNPTYGNFYLVDKAGDKITVYGLKANETASSTSFSSLGLKNGDTVTLIGNRDDYNETPQVKNAYCVGYEKIAAWGAPQISCFNNTVTISSDENVTIFYTLDGSSPTESSLKYLEPFPIDKDVTVKAIAVATGRPNSTEAVSNLTYVEIEEGGVTEVPITEWTLGSKAYSEKATINGTSNISVLKLGTGSAVGNATIVLPAGTVKVSYSAVAWNGKSGTVEFKNGSTTIVSQALKSNAGAANNTPYTMTTASTDNYEFNYSTDAETTITINTVSGKTRVIIWNIVAYVEN